MKKIVLAAVAALSLSGCIQPHIISCTAVCNGGTPIVYVVREPVADFRQRAAAGHGQSMSVNATDVVRRQTGFQLPLAWPTGMRGS